MSKLRYCPGCGQGRETKMKISLIALVITILFGLLGAVIYLTYCHYKKRTCVVCGTNVSKKLPPTTGDRDRSV
jgi:hypothetical protein